MNTIRNFTKILFVLFLTLALLGFYQVLPVVQAEGEQPVPVGIVSASSGHTCALTPTGAINCWGNNNYGQITGTPDSTVHFGTHPGPYTQVSTAYDYTCALKVDGSVDCWGIPGVDYGQAADQPGPYTQVSILNSHTCALTPSGAVDCWGSNHNGQLTGTADDNVHFGSHPGPYAQVGVGDTHTCALTPSGTVDCWGVPSYYWLDYGQYSDQPGPYTQLSVGPNHNCALTASGAVDCWGNNYSNQAVDQAGPYTQVSAGGYHTCALTPEGSVECWGDDSLNQSGTHQGPYTQVSASHYHTCALTPSGGVDCWGVKQYDYGQANDQSRPLTQVSAFYGHTCALTPTGAVECWGYNYSGQATNQPGPYTQASVGGYHTCALTPAGAVDCWGSNFYGQAADQPGPYTQVSSGDQHTCALSTSGAVDCWGENSRQQATDQPGLYTQVSSGYYHTCALKPDGSVDCWGDNDSNQLNGTDDPYLHFATLPGPYTQVSAAYAHTCALKQNGSIDCWGENDQGRLNGNPDYTVHFATLPGPYIQLKASLSHTCALTTSGSVFCWGKNDYGEITGTPDSTIHSGSLPGIFTQVSAGGYYTCALQPSGAVDCWGKNHYGQSTDQPIFGALQYPDTILDNAPANPSSSNVTFSFSSDIAEATFECQLDTGSWTDCTSPLEYNGLAEGDHTFQVRASNAAGVVDLSPANYTWTVDLTPPDTVLESTPSDPSYGGVTFTISSESGATFECRIDMGAWTTCSSPKVYLALSTGEHTFQVRATDVAGNTDASPAYFTWTVAGITPAPAGIVSQGQAHTCALKPDGSVDCWGSNTFGQAADQPGPYIQVTAGVLHTCALKVDASIDCWGYNGDGQATDQPGSYVQVSAGDSYTCALRSDGGVHCWGQNAWGQAADQTGPYTQISAGTSHTCGLTESGAVDCWGADGYDYGQAIDQTGPYTQVSAGYYHTCALTPSGAVDCWGGNPHGQSSDQPGPYIQVHADNFHTCALTPSGAVDCWGSNYYGQAADQFGPYTQVSSSTYYTCTLTPSGAVDCWGNNPAGCADDQPGPYGPYVVSNTLPILTNLQLSVAEDNPIIFTAETFTDHFSDADGDNLSSVKIISLPANGGLSLSGYAVTAGQAIPASSLGNLIFTPSANWHGQTSFFWNASDGTAYAASDANMDLTFSAVNDAPVVSSPLMDLNVAEDASSSLIDLSGIFNDVDIVTDGDMLTITADSGNPILVAASLSGTSLKLDHGADLNGEAVITVRATDKAGAYVEDEFVVKLNPVNDPPTATGQEVTLPAGAVEQVITLTGSDLETSLENLTFTIASNPAHGTVFGEMPNLVYAPEAGFSGDDSFTFTVTDGGDPDGCSSLTPPCAAPQTSAEATVTIRVQAAAPILTALSPAAAAAGSTDLTLTVTGSDFVDVSVVRWNGADLATTYVSDTQLTAILPAANLASLQTSLVTVFTPAPGGGTTQALPFYVTQSAANASGQDVSSGTDPSASSGPAEATASGEGLLAVAQYDANPGGTPSFTANGTYFDVYAAPGNTFTQVTIQACGMDPNDKLFWWDVTQGKWEKASPQTYNQATGCIILVVDTNSSPSLSQLQGTFFAIGLEPNTAPTAKPGGPYLAAINTVLSFDGSASSDPESDPLTYAWTFGNGSAGSSAAPTHTYTAPAIYDVCLTVNDGLLDSEPACTLAVIYDPSGGFVTGGGWILSPEGSYIPDPSLSGKATFGFVSKYLKGASTPTGNTEFRFQAGSFAFQSSSYDWLVVSKDKVNAQFKGSGTVNGALDPNGNAYRFMLWAGDGSPDTFRIRIWWEDADALEYVLYDNGFNQAIAGGSIVVHTSK